MMKMFVDGDWVNLTEQDIEYGAYAKLTMMDETIKRVRKLAVEWSEYKYSSDDHIPHDCMAYEEAGELLLKALDGDA
jgi:hypothetical protein